MRYFRVYRRCCRVKRDKELTQTEFEKAMWEEAWERAYMESDWDDESESEDVYLDRVNGIADTIYEIMIAEACKSGCCFGDYYMYIRDDDTSILDIEREN